MTWLSNSCQARWWRHNHLKHGGGKSTRHCDVGRKGTGNALLSYRLTPKCDMPSKRAWTQLSNARIHFAIAWKNPVQLKTFVIDSVKKSNGQNMSRGICLEWSPFLLYIALCDSLASSNIGSWKFRNYYLDSGNLKKCRNEVLAVLVLIFFIFCELGQIGDF